jgi:hypothetical protein
MTGFSPREEERQSEIEEASCRKLLSCGTDAVPIRDTKRSFHQRHWIHVKGSVRAHAVGPGFFLLSCQTREQGIISRLVVDQPDIAHSLTLYSRIPYALLHHGQIIEDFTTEYHSLADTSVFLVPLRSGAYHHKHRRDAFFLQRHSYAYTTDLSIYSSSGG